MLSFILQNNARKNCEELVQIPDETLPDNFATSYWIKKPTKLEEIFSHSSALALQTRMDTL